jgi:hypothetical protein
MRISLGGRTYHRGFMRRRRACALAAVWWVSACGAGWHREAIGPESELPPRQQVQLWMDGQSRVLHGVVVGADSVTGVPFHLPLTCDSCRIAVVRSAVDSMRLGNQERGAVRSIGLGFLSLAVAAVVLYFSVDTD